MFCVGYCFVPAENFDPFSMKFHSALCTLGLLKGSVLTLGLVLVQVSSGPCIGMTQMHLFLPEHPHSQQHRYARHWAQGAGSSCEFYSTWGRETLREFNNENGLLRPSRALVLPLSSPWAFSGPISNNPPIHDSAVSANKAERKLFFKKEAVISVTEFMAYACLTSW